MMDFKETEAEILRFWEENKIYEKSREKNAKGKKFYFMDGPPYASGHIHMGTALNKILKDIAMRFKRLQGHDVFDRPGYDTHGVPIELQIEKEIGLKTKQDIAKFGVEKFIERCKRFATQYIDVMNDEFVNLGVWMDWKNPYLTLSDEYIEAIWGAFKAADKKGLLYLDKYPVHLCTRCETAVSYNEIEYGKQRDTSIFVKFPLKEKGKENTFLVIWTTTPWTLPANTGIMVHPDVVYQEIETSEGERWIIAKDLVAELMTLIGGGFTVKEEFKGREMDRWKYESPLSKHINLKVKNGYKVVLSSRYVTTEDGTGLVHTAPGHGKEDYEVGKEYGLDAPSPVDIGGSLTEEAGKYSGKKARIVDKEIIEDLEKDGYLVHKFDYDHDYPLCWRCRTPLLMVSLPQWFLKISDIQKKLIEENENVKWVPDYMKSKMKAWLEGIGDWPVSRQRFWGTPLPIWYDPESGEKIVVGSVEELKKLSGEDEIDLHKPGIDKIEIKSKSGKTLKRVSEVLDVWFDAGVSSWAALGYPKEEDKYKKFWPADLNLEGKDQFRGWWNSQMVLSEIMFDKKPFENVMVHGMVLDVSKDKMSKSKGNIVSPKDVIDKYSRDHMRYYFAKLSRGEDFTYDEREFREIQNIFRVLVNINKFINQLNGKNSVLGPRIEDKWILSRLNSTVKEVTDSFSKYKFHEAVNKLEGFVIEDLSRTYIQIIRERTDEIFNLLNEIRSTLLKLFAPIVPFLTEEIWQDLKKSKIVTEESVHLSDWPKVNKKKIDGKLEKDFETVMRIIELGLAKRDLNKIGLKWPLAEARVVCDNVLNDELKKIIGRQLNVKSIEIKQGKELTVELNTKLTPELEAEGFAREITRRVQAERKKKGLQKSDSIELKLLVGSELKEMLKPHIDFIKERTGSKELDIVDKKMKDMDIFRIKEKEVGFVF